MFQRLLPKSGIVFKPRAVCKNAPDYSLAPPSHPVINSRDDISGITAACRLAKHVLDLTCLQAVPGVAAESLDLFAHNLIIERNAYPSPLGYKGYPRSICTSVNNIMCHGIPDDRKLVDGDILNIDVTVLCLNLGFSKWISR
jgi:methionyl aminopeptidase